MHRLWRDVWERVRSFVGRHEWMLNTVCVVGGVFFWCWYVVDLWVTGVVVDVYRVVTKPLRWVERGVFEADLRELGIE